MSLLSPPPPGAPAIKKLDPRKGNRGNLPPLPPGVGRRGLLSPAVVERAMMAIDAILIVCSGMASAYGYRWLADAPEVGVTTYASAATLVAINFVLLLIVQHAYWLKNVTNPVGQLRTVFTTWTAIFAALLAIGFSMKVTGDFSRGVILTFYATGLSTLMAFKVVAWRFLARAFRDGLFTNSRVAIIAEQGLSAASLPLHELRRHGYRPSYLLEISATELASPLLMSAIHIRFIEMISHCRENKVEQVFLLMNWGRQHSIESILDGLKVLPIPVHLIPDASVARFLKYPMLQAGDSWTAELRRAPLTFGERAIKRLFDLTGATLALVLFAPIMLFTGILIKSESKGPILFRQTRNGFGGSGFRIFKFRSMTVTEDGPTIVQATKNDRRVTRVGRWLRKTSIDELPQLLNVLQGDMSLVGPRPHAAAHNTEYERVISSYAFRHHVKPGITGWAQVNGYRGETNAIGLMEKRVEYDLWYINNWSLWLDITIVVKTALTSFRQSKAY